MTFSCPNYDLNSETCHRLNKLCVAGRPGCVLQDRFDFGDELEVRIKRAEERAEQRHWRKISSKHTPK